MISRNYHTDINEEKKNDAQMGLRFMSFGNES